MQLPRQLSLVDTTIPPVVDTTRQKDGRIKRQIRFELDWANDFDYQLAGHVKWLKSQRKFTSTFRDALRLLWDLQQGKTDVLRELFPHIGDLFASEWRVNEERLAELIAARMGQNTAPVRLIPVPDEDEPEVKITEAASGNEVQNLLNSIRGVTGKPTPKAVKSIAGAGNIAPPEFDD
jgi:hypothetical protein